MHHNFINFVFRQTKEKLKLLLSIYRAWFTRKTFLKKLKILRKLEVPVITCNHIHIMFPTHCFQFFLFILVYIYIDCIY